MKNGWRVCAWLLALLLAPAQAEEFLELTDFQLVDGTDAPPRAVKSMLVHDGRIVAIDAQGSRPAPGPGARWNRIDLSGGWVIPGLIDTHVHVSNFPDPRKGERILRSALRGGVTAVRDLAGDTRALAELERAILVREWQGPDLVYSALFGGPDVFKNDPTSTMAPGRVVGEVSWARRIDKDTDLRLAVAEARGTGARNIKVYADLDARLAAAIVREARLQGMLTTAHATVFPARPSDLVKAGVGSLAHVPYLVWEAAEVVPDDYGQRTQGPWSSVPPDHPRLLALYREMAKRGVFLDATLYVYKSMKDFAPGRLETAWTDAALDWGARATRLAREAGVRVTTGTDWFEPRDEYSLPHTHAELALLVELSGFTPQQAIIAATRNGAAALGLDEQGTLQLGKLADLVVLDADPLADIHNTERIRMTIKRGEVVRAN